MARSKSEMAIYRCPLPDTFAAASHRRHMAHTSDSIGDTRLLQGSSLYREFLAEKDEILKHKWIESEKQGFDIGFEAALVDWITKHRAGWRRARQAYPIR